MQNSKRLIAFLSIPAILIYFVPNMAQDIHRIEGHQIQSGENHPPRSNGLHNQQEECAVCVFEFNCMEETMPIRFVSIPKIKFIVFETSYINQVQENEFQHINLRALPQA